MDDTSPVVEQAVVLVKLCAKKNVVRLLDATDGVLDSEIGFVMDVAQRIEFFSERPDWYNLFSCLLPSGNTLVGRLTPKPKSLEGARKEVCCQCLFIKPDVFYQCGANPVMILHLALNTTKFALYNPEVRLRSFELSDEAAFIQPDYLRNAVKETGARALAALVQSVVERRQTLFLTGRNVYQTAGAFFCLLPVHARRGISFAVGLRFRNEPDLRLIGASKSNLGSVRRECVETADSFLDLLDFAENGDEYPENSGWGALVERVLVCGAASHFCTRLSNEFLDYPLRRSNEENPIMTGDEIMKLAPEWMKELDDFFSGSYDEREREETDSRLEYADSENDDEGEDEYRVFTAWDAHEDEEDGEEWKRAGGESDGDNFEGLLEWRELSPFEQSRDYGSVEAEDRFGDAAGEDYDVDPLETDSCDSLRNRGEAALAELNRYFAEELRELHERTSNSAARSEEEELEKQARRFFKPQGECKTENDEDETDNTFGESVVQISGLSLAPFAVLSMEFPEQNAVLRRLDTAIARACQNQPHAKSELEERWREFVLTQPDVLVERVRELYLARLYRLLEARENEESSEKVERMLGAVDVFNVIMK